MHHARPAHPLLHAAAAAVIASIALLAACEARMPTATELDRMDASAAQRSARALGLASAGNPERWFVDGAEVTEARAKAIPRDSIVRVDMRGLAPDVGLSIDIVTKQGQVAMANGTLVLERRKARGADGQPTLDPVEGLQSAIAREHPLLIIDGVRSDSTAFKSLDRSRIVNIELRKGAAAISEFGDAAKNGVIVVRLKP